MGEWDLILRQSGGVLNPNLLKRPHRISLLLQFIFKSADLAAGSWQCWMFILHGSHDLSFCCRGNAT